MKTLFVCAVFLSVTATASFGSVFLSIVTASPDQFCHFTGATAAVNCVSDSSTEGRAAISASPMTDGLGFTFTETFDMGPILFQSFGNVDLIASNLASHGMATSYTMTVLEQGTCTSNIADACSDFGFKFSLYPPNHVGFFTSSPQLQTVTGAPFANPDVFYAEFVLNHNTAANEHTSISGSLHIESITFASVPESSSGQLALIGLIGVCSWRALRKQYGRLVKN